MRKRAEQVDETRQRITEAAVRLHTTVGPAQTTISALAEEAGVTRLTVYRHFPDGDQLFDGCYRHWSLSHPPPDPSRWQELPVWEDRVRRALSDLYGWYSEHGGELFPIQRDVDAMPQSTQESMRAEGERLVEALLAGSGSRGAARRRLRAVAGHVVDFWTWRSLVVEQGLATEEAVELAFGFLAAARSVRRSG